MSKAIAYAENSLGVHECYQRAVDSRNKLDGILADLDKAQDERRSLVEEVADREAFLLTEEQGKHATQSATWLDQHMKKVKRQDDILRRFREQMIEVQSTISGLEYDADIEKHTIKIESARMEELGGYLNYLASVKQAENLTKLNTPGV